MTKRQLTLEMVQKYLGQEGKRYNGYVVFECPRICSITAVYSSAAQVPVIIPLMSKKTTLSSTAERATPATLPKALRLLTLKPF